MAMSSPRTTTNLSVNIRRVPLPATMNPLVRHGTVTKPSKRRRVLNVNFYLEEYRSLISSTNRGAGRFQESTSKRAWWTPRPRDRRRAKSLLHRRPRWSRRLRLRRYHCLQPVPMPVLLRPAAPRWTQHPPVPPSVPPSLPPSGAAATASTGAGAAAAA